MRFETVNTHRCNIFSACSGEENPPVIPDCSDPDYRATHPECGDDPRCIDPAFAEANPTLCLNTPRLIVKPSAAVVEVLQGVQYVAFLVTGGVEVELTEGVVWSVQDISIALISAGFGSATGVAAGITSVYATYGALTAAAQIEVIASGECATRANHFVLLFDSSKSMGGAFGGAFSTRLDMAKEVAENLITTANFTKDDYAVLRFDSAADEVLAFSQDAEELTDAIMGIATSQEFTNIALGLERARDYFDEQGVSSQGRVIVLFTDGENNTGVSPMPLAVELKAAGIILIVVGLRAKYDPYKMLGYMASGGFFVNALPDNAADVPGWVSGMRQYLCSGNCVPEGCVTLGVGELNFEDFINWEVSQGSVDLIGQNEGGTPLFDLIPSNGLYVDLCGSGGGSPSDLGTITTRDAIAVSDASEHEVTVTIAGNQREDRTPDVVLVEVIDPDNGDAVLESLEITVTNHAQGFTEYSFTFVPSFPTTQVKIRISQQSVATGGEEVFGCLLGSVELVDLGTETQLFFDDFDADNPTFINPGCGYCEGASGYGYDCYNTCNDGVIPGQIPDPSPLPNMEGEGSPTIYSSTKSATACCPDDLTECVERVAYAESEISQADADAKAYEAALTLAELALDCD